MVPCWSWGAAPDSACKNIKPLSMGRFQPHTLASIGRFRKAGDVVIQELGRGLFADGEALESEKRSSAALAFIVDAT